MLTVQQQHEFGIARASASFPRARQGAMRRRFSIGYKIAVDWGTTGKGFIMPLTGKVHGAMAPSPAPVASSVGPAAVQRRRFWHWLQDGQGLLLSSGFSEPI
ncbi:hypothetical protein ACQJBY_054536 [Aegilops geniculata]